MAVLLIIIGILVFFANPLLGGCIIGGLILICVAVNNNRSKKMSENKDNNHKILGNYSFCKIIKVGDYNFSLTQNMDKLFVSYTGGKFLKEPDKIYVNVINSCEIAINSIPTKSKVTKNAIVGGIVAGGVGSIIGASMANNTVNHIEVKFTLNDINYPIYNVVIYDLQQGIGMLNDSSISTGCEELKAVIDMLIK